MFPKLTQDGFSGHLWIDHVNICWPAMEQSQFNDTGLWGRKIWCLLQVPSRENGWLMFKRPEFLMVLKEAFLKTTFGGEGCWVHNFVWWVSGEALGWWFGNISHPPSASNSSGVCVPVLSMKAPSCNWVRAFVPICYVASVVFDRGTQIYATDSYICPLRRN